MHYVNSLARGKAVSEDSSLYRLVQDKKSYTVQHEKIDASGLVWLQKGPELREPFILEPTADVIRSPLWQTFLGCLWCRRWRQGWRRTCQRWWSRTQPSTNVCLFLSGGSVSWHFAALDLDSFHCFVRDLGPRVQVQLEVCRATKCILFRITRILCWDEGRGLQSQNEIEGARIVKTFSVPGSNPSSTASSTEQPSHSNSSSLTEKWEETVFQHAFKRSLSLKECRRSSIVTSHFEIRRRPRYKYFMIALN